MEARNNGIVRVGVRFPVGPPVFMSSVIFMWYEH